MSDVQLAIDYGTSTTVAVLRSPDGRVQPLLFDSSPLLASAVYLTADGQLLCGRDAAHSARRDPARYEPNPKRRIGDGSVLLGDRDVPVTEVVSATLRRIGAEATRVAGTPPASLVLTYPAVWGALRRGVLVDAADRAGLPVPRLVPEPVAAAAYFTSVLGHRIGPGQVVVIYDLGAGTLDVSVVRNTPTGFEVLAVDGLPDFGGVDLDAIVVDQVRPADERAWQRLTAPATAGDRRHARTLWDDARTAKEMLSRLPSAELHLPIADRDVLVARESFEDRARPALQEAAELTARIIERCGVPAADLAGLFLVGGSSRVPMVATTLHRTTRVAPTVLEQPELVVAHGALHTDAPRYLPSPDLAESPAPDRTGPPPVTLPGPLAPLSAALFPGGTGEPARAGAQLPSGRRPGEPLPLDADEDAASRRSLTWSLGVAVMLVALGAIIMVVVAQQGEGQW